MSRRSRLFNLLVIVCTACVILAVLVVFHSERPETAPYATYVERHVEETGATNRVASVYLNYRLYDSLLEILVFFVAVLGVRHYLGAQERTSIPSLAESEVVRTSAALLFPFALLLGVYLAALGQISPGGGFGSGVIVASGALLTSIALGTGAIDRRLRQNAIERIERGALFVLLLLTLLPLAFGRPALTDLLPKGRPGTVLSGGTIPLYNMLIALKVLAGSWLILRSFVRHRGEI
jgi:multicomponent Na+:H+ antiporter subunit B